MRARAIPLILALAALALPASAGAQTFSAFGTTGDGDGQFDDPLGVAVDQKGVVYVADSGNSRIEKFSNTGTFIGSIGPNVPGGTNLQVPVGVAVDNPTNQTDDPNIYVADADGHVQKLSPTGTLLHDFGAFALPVGIDVDATGHVLVADNGPSQQIVAKFAPDGTLLNVYGKQGGGPGSGPGEFNDPLDIATDPAGDIYVADSNNNRMQHLAPTGAFVSQTTGLSGAAGLDHALELTGPTTLVDRVWVTARGSNQFFKLDDTGAIVETEGGSGAGLGQFNAPYGLAVDCDGNVFVADSANNRIQRFGDTDTPPCTPPDNTSSPALAGQPQVGSGLALDPGTWTGSPTPRLSYRWQRCTSGDPASCGDIAGQRGLTYTVTDADRGFRIRAAVVGANVDGIIAEPTDMTPPIPTVPITPLPPAPPNPPPTPPAPPAPSPPTVDRTGFSTFTVGCPLTGQISCEVLGQVRGRSGKRTVTLAAVSGEVRFNESGAFKLRLTKRGRQLAKQGYHSKAVFRVLVDGNQIFQAGLRFNRAAARRIGGGG